MRKKKIPVGLAKRPPDWAYLALWKQLPFIIFATAKHLMVAPLLFTEKKVRPSKELAQMCALVPQRV
jgi:hypothetical protein